MVGTVSPYREIDSGQLSAESIPVSVPDPNAPQSVPLSSPQSVFFEATEEQIQDYVAALFVGAPHVNLSANYNDAGNLLAFTVDIDSAVAAAVPPEVSSAIDGLNIDCGTFN